MNCPLMTLQCLLGIILMQTGQEYARRQEEAEQRKLDARTVRAVEETSNAAATVGGEVKKDL